MSSSSPSTESSMYLLFGTFLSGLIVTEFLKESSQVVHASLSSLVIVLFGTVWIFFVVFDTLVWLVYCKEHPSLFSATPTPLRLFIHLFRRIIEFGSLIWLYDIINIVKQTAGCLVIKSLEAFTFDLAVICLAWSLHRSLQPLVEGCYSNIDFKDWQENSLRLFSFAGIFFGLSALIAHNYFSPFCAFSIVGFFMFFHIILNFYVGWQNYYQHAFQYYIS